MPHKKIPTITCRLGRLFNDFYVGSWLPFLYILEVRPSSFASHPFEWFAIANCITPTLYHLRLIYDKGVLRYLWGLVKMFTVGRS